LKILLVSSEVTPYAKTGGLADVAGSLPRALRQLGHDVRVIMPCYRTVIERGYRPEAMNIGVEVSLAGRVWQGNLRQLTLAGVPVYFIDQPELFDRADLYGEAGVDYPDNAERFGFFCRAIPGLLKQLDFCPDILHLNDWQTGLIPLLLKTELAQDPFFDKMASLITIHNLGYQGLFPAPSLKQLGLNDELFHPDGIEYFDQVSFLKAGLFYADQINTVSPTYCREICTPEFGAGFEGILQARQDRLSGVLNGIDPGDWDPSSDDRIPHNFNADDLSGKSACKLSLQQELGLKPDPRHLLIALVTRLDVQKGLDLLDEIWPELMQRPVQLALLGSGDPELTARFKARQLTSQGQAALHFGFDDGLARRIYAGSDLFLMPSRYEPCGLGQLIALRYGAVPLVRATGGLVDTITDIDTAPESGNGFSFKPATGHALLASIDRALARFRQPHRWQSLVSRGMRQDFSWTRSATIYLRLYQNAMEDRHV
jgi:starch synthase